MGGDVADADEGTILVVIMRPQLKTRRRRTRVISRGRRFYMVYDGLGREYDILGKK